MESYTLEKTGLELAGGRLIKKDKQGVVEATFDVSKIKHASVTSSLDPMGVILTFGALGLTFVFFRFMPDGLWRWLAVVISGTAFFACTLGVKSRSIVIEVGCDRLEYQSLDLPDRLPSFVAMINQARAAGESGESPEPTPTAVTPDAQETRQP